MSPKMRIQEFVNVLNDGHTDAISTFYSDDLVAHRAEGDYGLEEVQAELEAFHHAIPQCHREVSVLLEEGDFAVCRMVVSGRFERPYTYPASLRVPEPTPHLPPRPVDVEPSGRLIRWPLTMISRFDETGRCVEEWQSFDRSELFRQLAGMPSCEALDRVESLVPKDMSPGPVSRARMIEAAETFVRLPSDPSLDRDHMLEIVGERYTHNINALMSIDLDHLLGGHRDEIIGAVSNYRLQRILDVAEGPWLAALYRTVSDTKFDGIWRWPDGSVSQGKGEPFEEVNLFLFHFGDDGRITADWHGVDFLTVFSQLDRPGVLSPAGVV